ncbi:MAG: MlaD family protein [Halorhodospira sp.]
MEPRAHHFWIGLATLLLAAGGVILGVWLADRQLYGERQHLEVVFNEDVSGLSQRSPVKLNGITVGEIEQLYLDPKDPRRVIARLSIGPQAPLTTATEVQLGSSGLFTGGAHIRLKAGDPEAPPLTAAGDGIPRLKAEPSPLAQLREDSDQLLANIDRLIGQANQAFSRENIAKLSAILEHLERTTGTVAEHDEDLGRGLTALADTGEQAEQSLAQAEQLIREGRTLLEEPGTQILRSTRRATQALAESSEITRRLLRENQDALAQGMQGLHRLEPLTAELQRTLQALRATIQRLGENPGGQLLHRERMEEYQP